MMFKKNPFKKAKVISGIPLVMFSVFYDVLRVSLVTFFQCCFKNLFSIVYCLVLACYSISVYVYCFRQYLCCMDQLLVLIIEKVLPKTCTVTLSMPPNVQKRALTKIIEVVQTLKLLWRKDQDFKLLNVHQYFEEFLGKNYCSNFFFLNEITR